MKYAERCILRSEPFFYFWDFEYILMLLVIECFSTVVLLLHLL